MPEQREDDWRKAVILMASATEKEMLDPELPGTTLLHRLFHQEQPRVSSSAAPSRRAAAAAASASTVCCASIRREELGDLRDKTGRVAVKCEFCSTEYAYDDNDLDRLYAAAD
jgi:molecular chaperone Hsp33